MLTDSAFISGVLLSLLPIAMNVIACCCSCSAWFEDSFTRSDSTTIGSGTWTEVSGAFEIASNTLKQTDGGVAIVDAAQPDGNIAMSVECEFKAETNATTPWIVVGYVDSTHYFYARFIVNGASSQVMIRRNNGGVITTLATSVNFTMSAGTWYTGKVCVDYHGHIAVFVDGSAKISTGLSAASITGTQCGVGGEFTTNYFYDNFVATPGYEPTDSPSCPKCGRKCGNGCKRGTLPNQFQVEFEGSIEGSDSFPSHSCTDAQCATLVATWVLDLTSYTDTGTSCTYGISTGLACTDMALLQIKAAFVNTCLISVQISNAGDSVGNNWLDDLFYSDPPTIDAELSDCRDCHEMANEPFFPCNELDGGACIIGSGPCNMYADSGTWSTPIDPAAYLAAGGTVAWVSALN